MPIYTSHHLTGEVPSGNGFVRNEHTTSTTTESSLSVHETMPCREGTPCATSTCIQPLCTTKASSQVWGVSCRHCDCRTREELGNRNWLTTDTADHPMINPVEHLQECTIMCICSSHMPVFQTSRNMKMVIFSDNSISHIAISAFTCEQWEVEDLVIKENKVNLPWMLYFWIALGHTALPRTAAEGIPSF